GWSTQCQAHFHQHIAKGDPRDVAAYCAFMWYHGWKTESVSAPVVPEEVMPGGLAYLTALPVFEGNDTDKIIGYRCLIGGDTRIVESQEQAYVDGKAVVNACRVAMLQSKYRDLSQPVDPQISEYEQIMLQAGWVMVPIEPTDEMIAAAMECDDVVFDSKDPTAFCVQYREIYCAMVDVAPQPEGNDR
ncbi:hypothetical protein NI479_004792, partial [Salmonella enterica]|nr:hypothetical protein [Salmonella enterica]EJJ4347552.1 hypothetical protein [Salmonella enterica]